MNFIGHFLVATLIFVAIDAVWLSTMSKRFYRKNLGKLLSEKPNFIAAAVFYTIYIVGIIIFVLDPALTKDSVGFVASRGALLGLTMYATYDLTNQATLKNWPTIISVVDMVWGTVITGTVATITFLIFAN